MDAFRGSLTWFARNESRVMLGMRNKSWIVPDIHPHVWGARYHTQEQTWMCTWYGGVRIEYEEWREDEGCGEEE